MRTASPGPRQQEHQAAQREQRDSPRVQQSAAGSERLHAGDDAGDHDGHRYSYEQATKLTDEPQLVCDLTSACEP